MEPFLFLLSPVPRFCHFEGTRSNFLLDILCDGYNNKSLAFGWPKVHLRRLASPARRQPRVEALSMLDTTSLDTEETIRGRGLVGEYYEVDRVRGDVR